LLAEPHSVIQVVVLFNVIFQCLVYDHKQKSLLIQLYVLQVYV